MGAICRSTFESESPFGKAIRTPESRGQNISSKERPLFSTETELIVLLERVERKLLHTFVDKDLLLEALTHSSFSNERTKGLNNERLEFLGDAVIGLVIAEELMNLFPTAAEGQLSRWRSSLVSRKTLSEVALNEGMNESVLLGKGERSSGGGTKTSILSGVFEAVIAALYLDAGFEVAKQYLIRVYQPWFEDLIEDGERLFLRFDQKTHLQEKTQSLFKSTPVYRVVEAFGAEHKKTFRVEIEIDGRVFAEGLGPSKKEAEQEAASMALRQLGDEHGTGF